MKEKEVELVPGSLYTVYSLGSEKTHMKTSGIFTGYAYLSKDEVGICIEMDASHGADKGRMRIIPVSMILAIDVIEEREQSSKSDEEEPHYFR